MDAETGLYYNRFRYFDAEDVRFTDAIRPRTKETIVPCDRCAGKYGSNQFLGG